MSMADNREPGQLPGSHAVCGRALRALAVAQIRLAHAELAQLKLLRAIKRSEQLQAINCDLVNRLRETIGSVAREELAGGHSPVQMVVLLHDIVNEAILERRMREEIEPDIVEWGIDAYFAA